MSEVFEFTPLSKKEIKEGHKMINEYFDTKYKDLHTNWNSIMGLIHTIEKGGAYHFTISKGYLYIDDQYQRVCFSGNDIGQSEVIRDNKLIYLFRLIVKFVLIAES